MVRKIMCLVFSMLVLACFCGCSKSELTYKEAQALFKVGMTQGEAEKAFGKPQIADELSGTVTWTYFPEHKIESGGSGEFSGFIIDFKEGKATAITEHISLP